MEEPKFTSLLRSSKAVEGSPIKLEGKFTGGDLHPLAGVVPANEADVAVIKANASSPLDLALVVDMSTERVLVELDGDLQLSGSAGTTTSPVASSILSK